LEEKETLLSEIHHRVKNNLQVAISILSLQSRYIPDESLKTILRDNQNRFRAMGLVHETLYNSSSLSHINLKEYIQRLTAGLYEAYAARTADISLSLDVDPMEVNIDQAMPCGLVLNELVANSLKHAFPGGGPGRIWIAARDRGDGWVEMTVADDGIGLPPDINLQHHGTLGLRLTVRTVENQLRGVLSVERGAGAVFHIKFHRRTDHRI
jgi:two-component sensor histidine kinase